jgi:hypothetical protein
MDPCRPAGRLLGRAREGSLGAGGFLHQEHAWRSIEATRRMGKEILPVRGWVTRWWGERGLVPHPFLIGFGTAGRGRSRQRFRQQGIGFRGRHHHPGMVGGIYPRNGARGPKSRAPVRALAGAPHVAQPGLSQRDTHAIYRHPNPRCQIKSWLSWMGAPCPMATSRH